MNTQENIQSGHGLDRSQFPEEWKSEYAKKLWNDSSFMFGMEYGYLLAMAERGPANARELEVLQTWVDTWADSECPLPGGMSYADVQALIHRLGLRMPSLLENICSGDYEQRMKERSKIESP